MKKIKSYFAFTPIIYRLLVMVACPVVLLGIELFSRLNGRNNLEYLLGIMLLAVEVVLDFWFLGGIYNKKEQGIEYLKSSKHGNQMLKDVVVVNMIRVALGFTVVIVGCEIIDSILFGWGEVWTSEVVLQDLVYILWGYNLVIMMNVVTRHFTNYMPNILFAYLATMLYFIPILFMMNGYLIATVICGAIVAVGFSIFSAWYIERKVKDSYYDKED